MKRIRRLREPTPGLASYLELEMEDPNWEGFRDHNSGASYRELIEALVALQHGLCGYCEIDLIELDRQIEHVVPQSDPVHGSSGALDPTNMIASCKGGTSNLFGPESSADKERFLAPPKRNTSCGQAKSNRSESEFVDPRKLPALPSVTKVRLDGRIEPDADACADVDISVDMVRKTIEILGLNVKRLCVAREHRWTVLNESWAMYFDDSEVLKEAAREELLPRQNNRLPKFFTTSRSYFEVFGESVLAERPQDWI